MPPKELKNRLKIRCLECNVEMDFDYKNKHNLKFHQVLLRHRKSIRYNVVGAPKNPFEAAAGKSSKLYPRLVYVLKFPTRLYKMMGSQLASCKFDVNYVRGTYRRIQRFPPPLWNVDDAIVQDDARTNNLCECWNHKFFHLVGHNYPLVWRLIDCLK